MQQGLPRTKVGGRGCLLHDAKSTCSVSAQLMKQSKDTYILLSYGDSASTAYLVICRQPWHLLSKVFVKQVQGHLIMGALAVSQEVVKAHGVVPC